MNEQITETNETVTRPIKSEPKISIPAAILAGAVIIALALVFVFSGKKNTATQPQQAGQQPAVAVDIKKVKIEGDAFVGNPNAPVTIAYWSDYQCPFCKRFEDDTVAQLMTDYVETGKVKLVFKNYQFLGPDSTAAGLASEAVWEVAPDQFYAWHKAVFAKQDTENGGWGNQTDILSLTKTVLGAENASKVASLMKSKEAVYTQMMDADKAEGTSFGVNGTPGAIIGKTLIQGAQPYSEVQKAVEAELKK